MVLSPEHLVWFQGKQFSGLERRQSDHLEGKAWLGTSDSGAQVLVMLLDCLGDAGQDLPLSLSLSSPKIERSLEISTSPNMSLVLKSFLLPTPYSFLLTPSSSNLPPEPGGLCISKREHEGLRVASLKSLSMKRRAAGVVEVRNLFFCCLLFWSLATLAHTIQYNNQQALANRVVTFVLPRREKWNIEKNSLFSNVFYFFFTPPASIKVIKEVKWFIHVQKSTCQRRQCTSLLSLLTLRKKKKKSDSNSLTLKRNLLAHLIKKNESTPASLRTCSLSSSLS